MVFKLDLAKRKKKEKEEEQGVKSNYKIANNFVLLQFVMK